MERRLVGSILGANLYSKAQNICEKNHGMPRTMDVKPQKIPYGLSAPNLVSKAKSPPSRFTHSLRSSSFFGDAVAWIAAIPLGEMEVSVPPSSLDAGAAASGADAAVGSPSDADAVDVADHRGELDHALTQPAATPIFAVGARASGVVRDRANDPCRS